MLEFIKAASVDDVSSGEMKNIKIKEREILLARQGDVFYATANRCPHMGGNLSKGTLQGHVVTCPVHGSQFDLSNGKVIRWTNFSGVALAIGKKIRSPRPLTTYPVKISQGDVLVKL